MVTKNGEESNSFFKYDVFLSFRGEDTRYSFIGHLRNELKRNRINTFLDDEGLRIGQDISPALSKAIEDSKICIIVLSKDYATSSWCLAELVKIIDCVNKSNNKQLAVPIFYHVDPTDVRKQKNSYEDAMIEHENRFGKDSENVQAWRSALSQVANLKGHHISTGYENDYIEKIVKDVSAKIAPTPLETGGDLVGLEQRIEDVMSLLDMKPNEDDDTVSMLCIHGLGGIGKTTLAKALYNRIAYRFEAASFLKDVGEKSKRSITDLQKILLSEMKEELDREPESSDEGMSEIRRRLKDKKVLLVLDDVIDNDNLKHLAGDPKNEVSLFGPGSRIIITTRDKKLLHSHYKIVNKNYEMTELNYEHSLELFCRNAFKQSCPKKDFEVQSSRAVNYAQGLPLALKVIGSDLADETSIDIWESVLKEYANHSDIHGKLKISYDRLKTPNCKLVFLDIACFFKGEKRDYVQEILKDYNALHHIDKLVNKSLLSVENGCLKMHDLIQDMGRTIGKEASREFGGRRILSDEDVIEVLEDDDDLESKAIGGILLDPPQKKEVNWSGDAFKKMNSLRILIVRNTAFSTGPKHLPSRHLLLLDWEDYPSKSLPSDFRAGKIAVLNLPKSKLMLDEPFKKFSCLTNMNLSHSQSIIEMPDLSQVQSLRELILDSCRNMVAIHESVGLLKNLARVSASNCAKLKIFLQKMYLPSLEILELNLCERLEQFPDVTKQMNKPLKIFMKGTAIKELPNSIGNLIGLVYMDISGSTELRYLPSSLFMLPNVATFKIEGCSQLGESFRRFAKIASSQPSNVCPKLETLYFENGGLSDADLHTILNCFPNLKELIAPENNFESLPACIQESVNLTTLDVSDCRKLRTIPECKNLTDLDVHLCVNLEHISELPSTIQKVDARNCFSLNRETKSMLWSQVSKEISGLEMVMPEREIPVWFDFACEGGNPRFWARRKFPVIALALVFHDLTDKTREFRVRRKLVELRLVINGQFVPCKGYRRFRIEADHVLICDLRLLFSDKEWLGLDSFLDRDWNQIQVSYDANSSLMLTSWGIFAYKKGTNNMEDVQFMCPDPNILAPTMMPVIPAEDPHRERKKKIEELALEIMFDETVKERRGFRKRHNVGDNDDFEEEQDHVLMEGLESISKEAKAVLGSSEAGGGGSGLLKDKKSNLGWLLDTMKSGEDNPEPGVHFHNDLALIRLPDGALKQAMEEGKPIDISSIFGAEGKNTTVEELQQDIDPIQDGLLMGIFLDGILDGLREAQRHFPDLDVDTTAFAAYNKGNKVVLQLPQSMVEVEPPVEMKKHIEGIIIGLKEAKLSFPDLDLQGILNTVLSRGASYPKIGIVKRAMEVGESSASTSGLKGKISTEELQDIDPHQQEELLMGIFYNGIVDGLVQAKSHFPDLDIDTTATNAFTNGKKFMMLLPLNLSMLENDGGCEPPIEKKKYIEGIIIGLFQAKLSFPDLDVRGIVNIVLARGARNNGEVGPIEALPPSVPTLDWSNVTVPGSDEDPLSQVFMMMKQESLEYEANNGRGYLKLKEEHTVLRNRLFEQVTENEAATLVDEDTNSFPSWKKQYDELMEKLNDASDSKLCVGKNDKLAAVLKGRDEELRRLCDDGIEGFQRSQEFQDLMSAVYLNGLRDGILEARALLLALNTDTTETPSPLVSEENEERVTVDTPEEDAAEVPSATGPEGFNPPPDTSTPSALDVDYHLEDDDFGRFFF